MTSVSQVNKVVRPFWGPGKWWRKICRMIILAFFAKCTVDYFHLFSEEHEKKLVAQKKAKVFIFCLFFKTIVLFAILKCLFIFPCAGKWQNNWKEATFFCSSSSREKMAFILKKKNYYYDLQLWSHDNRKDTGGGHFVENHFSQPFLRCQGRDHLSSNLIEP